jgi:hypothetical protein
MLEMKLANGGIISKNEASFQLELGYILKVFGQLYEFHPNEKFNLEMESYVELKNYSIKSKSKKARVDIIMTFGTEDEFAKGAIELKFFKKKNHREPNNRYDIFKDIANLEAYKENGIDLNYLFLSTDHSHYVNQLEYSADTKDFDIRKGSRYTAGKILEYRTAKPFGPPIILRGNYEFDWSKPTDNIYFTKIEI